MYTSSTSLYIYSSSERQQEENLDITSSELTASQQLADTCGVIIQSNSVLGKVIDQLGLSISEEELRDRIEVATVNETEVISVSVSDTNPEQAQNIANTIADVLPDEFERVVKAGGVEVVDYAEQPDKPSSPNILLNTFAGVLAGFLISCGVVFLIEFFDTRVRDEEGLSEYFDYEIPVLGVIPPLGENEENKNPKRSRKRNEKNNRKTEKRVIITDIKKMLKSDAPFRIKEAYNLVRAKLLFTTRGEKCPVYVVTSSRSDEGKTINAINMAISFAMAGKKTLLIDADLRNPTLHKYFRVSPSPGLSEVLAKIQGKINVTKTEQENLFFLRAGEIPPNPAELLGSAGFGEILVHLEEKFDYIFIDMPPMGIVADAAVVNEYVTGYILVVQAMETEFAEIQWTVDKLKSFNANLAGFLLNDVSGSDGNHSEYGHYGYYPAK